MADPAIGVHVPHLVDVEVVQALRRLASLGELTAVEAQTAIDDLRSLDLCATRTSRCSAGSGSCGRI